MSALKLRVEDLQCSAGLRVLFEGLNLELRNAQGLLLVGPNGSGKTTLLRALAGLARPSRGRVRWRFERSGPSDSDSGRDAREDEPAIGTLCLYHGHANAWKGELTVTENLVLQCALDGADVTDGAIAHALERAGIGTQSSLHFARLSAGQRRRLTLARLMLDRRPAWLLDEPATALDDAGVELLASLIDAKLSSGGIVVTATHHELGCRNPMPSLNLSERSAVPRPIPAQ